MSPESSVHVRRGRAGDQSRDSDRVDPLAALRTALSWARVREYTGWDYADGMSSRVRRALPVENRWLNLAVQEAVKRSPVNLRPLLLVEQRRSFMSAGLFAATHRNLDVLGDDRFDNAAAATDLAAWLVDNRCPSYSGFCGGHRHQNQHIDHRTFPTEPDVVSTSFAVTGLLAAAAYDPSFADVARTSERFLVSDMNYRRVDGGAKVDYYPKDTADHYTLNAGAIAARTLIDLYDRFGGECRRERAQALLDYVVARQTDAGGWYYRDPPDASHLSMDTHHNGFVIECLQRYETVTGDGRYDDALADAVAFFSDRLFDASGAPNWDEDDAYPRDVHAAAQGIIVFTKAGDLSFARRVVDWTLSNLYDGGRFYFRRHRLYTNRTTLMRWCQAWSCYALSTYLRASREN